jgi:hypothetical protein
MKTQSLKIDLIHMDSGTQSRAWTNEDAIADYSERMECGDKFPPVDVFFDGNEHHLADGFHRVLAATRCGFKDILACVHKGTLTDAIWFAIGANKSNGIKRTAGDKKKSIEIALSKFPDKTQQQIAEHVGCSQRYVSEVQNQLRGSSKLILPATRKGKDGKSYPTKYAKASDAKSAEKDWTSEDSELPEICPKCKTSTMWEVVGKGRICRNCECVLERDDEEEAPHIVQHTPEEVLTEVASHVEPRVTEYYERLERVMLDAINNATDKQLASMGVYAALLPKLIKDELNRRK